MAFLLPKSWVYSRLSPLGTLSCEVLLSSSLDMDGGLNRVCFKELDSL